MIFIIGLVLVFLGINDLDEKNSRLPWWGDVIVIFGGMMAMIIIQWWSGGDDE